MTSAHSVFAGAIDDLDFDKQNKVKNEQQVAIFENIEGEVWPKSTIYEYIKATPEEAAAVFFDYKNHCNVMPDCTSVTMKPWWQK